VAGYHLVKTPQKINNYKDTSCQATAACKPENNEIIPK
jgi:hypothetical protein